MLEMEEKEEEMIIKLILLIKTIKYIFK